MRFALLLFSKSAQHTILRSLSTDIVTVTTYNALPVCPRGDTPCTGTLPHTLAMVGRGGSGNDYNVRAMYAAGIGCRRSKRDNIDETIITVNWDFDFRTPTAVRATVRKTLITPTQRARTAAFR